MTVWVLVALAIYLVQTLLGPTCRWLLGDKGRLADALGPRDTPPPQSVAGARFERAVRNMEEALFLFLPIALLLEMKGLATSTATTGAMLFVAARALYVVAYASGVFALRSIVWACGHAGIAMMAATLVRG